MANKFYVYEHIRNDTGEVFYVGKGHRNRAYSTKNRNEFWWNIVKKHGYTVKIVQSNLSESESFNLEIKLISLYRSSGGCYCNMTPGGDGRSGYTWSPSSIEKRTRTILGKARANKGYRWTEDQKINLSKVMSRKKHKDSRPVIDTATGILYHSAKDAALCLSLPVGSIYKILKGIRANKTTLSYLEISNG
jgi:hypothetical protein